MPFHHAPNVVFISAEETEAYGAVYAANAAQNMAVAAWLLGIGSCYIAPFQVAFSGSKRESYLERLNLPDKNMRLSFV
ncbi:nitroreductase family protein [endosymbiont 'TC1' of Trimyema compressum]|uniref:nitroreductase family protein n=1 Tax=endosymbiont 'TC1' of Trimyema compressum TaxID=243899 RepID=UPI000B4C6571